MLPDSKVKVSRINVIETSHTLRRLTRLFSSEFDITEKENTLRYYYTSVITEIVIHLRDLIAKLKKANTPIEFPGKTLIGNELVEADIIALILYFRDASCHNDSPNRRNSEGYLRASIVNYSLPHKGEITVEMGDKHLFVHRHIIETYKIIFHLFSEFIEFQENDVFKEAMQNFTEREKERPPFKTYLSEMEDFQSGK